MTRYAPGVFASLANSQIGQRVWTFLTDPENLVRMETATALERPAVEGIEEQLLHEFGNAVLDDRTKQMLGHMVRQIMEDRGYMVAVQNVKITNGGPFSRATRYKRRDEMEYCVFKNSSEPRTLALTSDREGRRLPALDGNAHWVYWKNFRGALRARITLGIENLAHAHAEIEQVGYYVFALPRLLRAS